jgi:hypothetical protein
MHYTCLYCGAVLAVDPMEMLNNFFIKGIPCKNAEDSSRNVKNKKIPQPDLSLRDAFKRISES